MNWINVKDRLPEVSGVYPAYSQLLTRSFPTDWADALCYYDKEAGPKESKWQHSSGFYDNGITHWLELTQ